MKTIDVLHDLFNCIRHDQCPKGCVALNALELACIDHLQAWQVHSATCPYGKAYMLLRAKGMIK